MAAIYADDFCQARVYPSDSENIAILKVTEHSYIAMIPKTHANNINVLELAAVHLALFRWSSLLSNCRIVLHCDNLQVCYNLSKDKTRNELSNSCLRDIFWICVTNNIYIYHRRISRHRPILMLITCHVLYILTDLLDNDKAEIIKLQAFAPNTLKTRLSQWKKYYSFCDQHHLKSIPVTPQNVCRFLVSVGDTLTYTTMNNYVSAVNVLGKFYDGAFDLRQDFGVLLLLRGFRRLKGDTSHPKDPISPEDLKHIAAVVNYQDPTELVIWVIVLLAFRTLLRKSQFVSAHSDDQEHLLRVRDLTFTDWGCSLHISSSKTIQFSERNLDIPINVSSKPLCVVSLLKEYLQGNPKSPSDFLFSIQDSHAPVPYSLALNQLKTWCRVCGMSKDIGFHSLRRGAASHMHSLNIGLLSIQMAGD